MFEQRGKKMLDQTMTISVEFSSSIAQHDIWSLEERFQQVEGVKANLVESKDFATATILLLQFVASIMGPIAVIGGGIKSIHEVAKILYEFLHHSNSEKVGLEGKKKVCLIKDGRRVEIYNLSVEEIEKIINEE